MRTTFLPILLMLFTFNSLTAQQPRIFAVVVGCADYKKSNLDLRFSDDDAYRFYAYLKSCEGGAVPDENIAVLVDEAATKNNIIQTMNDIFSKASANDLLMFYFSGHGAENAFCPTDITDQYNSLLLHSEVKAVFKKYPARYKICYADACYSGSIYQGTPTSSPVVSGPAETSVAIMMSSKNTETSQENSKMRQGAFTYYLIKGLKGSADRDNDKIINLGELFTYVKGNVLNFTKNSQTPVIEGNASRDMPLAVIR
jgi:hypothetical protein